MAGERNEENPGPANASSADSPPEEEAAMPRIDDDTPAFSHVPEHGFSLFLAKRTKTVHFVRHAEGEHNEADRRAGDDSPVTYSTGGSWRYRDARLTPRGVAQCVTVRQTLLRDVRPQLVVVSPFSRTLQTAHVMFGGGGAPFLVHDLARERSGRFTCDKRRTRSEIVAEMGPVYEYTNDRIDFDRFGYPTEDDPYWTEDREPSDAVTSRAVAFMQWLATRPETEIAVVTHSSWLKHLFRAFGRNTADADRSTLHRLAGNAEVRTVCLALHRGFYPDGEWEEGGEGDGGEFVPHDHSFRRGRWAPSPSRIARMHERLAGHQGAGGGKSQPPPLKEQESMPV
jgi:broad specificity phosphatase PhoE